ncbi:MAG: PE domain-containing protein [Mycobacterium sp.]|nr:PE domain-containing protein [Mycobacterium sp.]
MITRVDLPILMAGVDDVVANVTGAASAVAAGVQAVTAPAVAGTDEASALASLNTGVHGASFLAIAGQAFVELARYAGVLGSAYGTYAETDAANGAVFG